MSIGLDFPLQDNNIKKDFLNLTTLNTEAIKANLILFLVTTKGERYMRPNFGADLKQFIFEQNDSIQRDIIEDYLKTEIERQFTNITVNFVETQNTLEDDDNILVISVDFTYTNKTFTYNDLLVLEFVL